MNVNYGLFPPLAEAAPGLRKREKNERRAARALAAFEPFVRRTRSACA
jgi:folate-dependent tRNA-U54 methylase TrmFO/GidA